MNIMLIACEISLVALSIQILKVNSVSPHVFPEISFPFSPSKFNLSYFTSLLYVNVPDVNSFKLTCLNDLKHIVSSIDELALKLYKKINVLIQNRDNFFFGFEIPKFSWNWTRWHPDFTCLKFNASDFDFHIANDLIGQHIVSLSLPKLLNDHLGKSKSTKPLLISFQGPTGSGKSFVSKMIVQSLYQEGFNSKFIQIYYGSQDFFHEREKESYHKRLLHEIPFLLSLCDKSVFIFEEMDKMVPGVIDVILPFIYFHNYSSDTNSIFVFISNSGTKKIEEIMYNAWFEGVPREDLTLEKFACYLKEAAYYEPGGLQYSEIIRRDVIDVYLPFLPLEREHIKQCITKELILREMAVNKDLISFIADQIIYHPAEFEVFAESGCKRVSQKVDLYGDEGDL